MSKPFWWIGCVLMCIALAGCEADQNLVQEPETGYIDADGYAVGTPYWWRTHPYGFYILKFHGDSRFSTDSAFYSEISGATTGPVGVGCASSMW